jgi:hypothetical protein
MPLINALSFIIAIGAITILLFYLFRFRRGSYNNWLAVANITGLNLRKSAFFSGYGLEGLYEGYKVTISETIVFSEDKFAYCTLFEMFPQNKYQHNFRLKSKTGFMGLMCNLMTLRNIVLCNDTFDDFFYIQSDSQIFVKHVVNPAIQKLIVAELPNANLSLRQNRLTHTVSLLENNGEKILSTIKIMNDICKAIDTFVPERP